MSRFQHSLECFIRASRVYKHSRLCWNIHLYRRPTEHGAVSWLQPESSVGRCCKLANWPSPRKGHCWRIHCGHV